MSVMPNIFMPTNKAQKAMYCYRNTFRGKRLRYTTIAEQEDETLATKNFTESNECNVLRDVGEDPLRPGVLVTDANISQHVTFIPLYKILCCSDGLVLLLCNGDVA
ncbi:unnamed protein product [Prunus brigantina]